MKDRDGEKETERQRQTEAETHREHVHTYMSLFFHLSKVLWTIYYSKTIWKKARKKKQSSFCVCGH